MYRIAPDAAEKYNDESIMAHEGTGQTDEHGFGWDEDAFSEDTFLFLREHQGQVVKNCPDADFLDKLGLVEEEDEG